MKSVFVSSSYADRAFRDFIQRALEQVGVAVVDDRHVGLGTNWEASVVSAIKESDVLIARFGPGEPNANVMFEIGCAIGAGRAVILVSDEPGRIPLDLASLPVIFAKDSDARLADALVDFVRQITPHAKVAERRFESARDELATVTQDPSYFDAIPGVRFEELVAEFLDSLGFESELTRSGKDSGFDIRVRGVGGQGFIAVEVKKRTAQGRISIAEVQRFVAAALAAGATSAMVVACSGYTKSAIEFSTNVPIKVLLYTLEELLSVTKEHVMERLAPVTVT